LLRKAVESYSDLGFSFLYTVPNEASAKVAERVGVRSIANLKCFARPVDLDFYLQKFTPRPIASILSYPAEAILKFFSKESWRLSRESVEEVYDIDERFNVLWQNKLEATSGIISDRSAEFLRWRYLRNPMSDFRTIICKKWGSDELSGYLFFCLREGDKIDIYDIVAKDGSSWDSLISRVIDVARREKHQAVYILAREGSTIFKKLKSFHFLDTNITLKLGSFGEPEFSRENWEFLNGDRNI
jgi:hypothetical protein